MVQSRTTKRVVTRNLIKALGIGGALTMALVAPNSTVLLDRMMKTMDKRVVKRALSQLKYRKLVEVKTKNGQPLYKLTNKGMDRFEKIIIEELFIATPKRWDKKWRMIIFDIPAESRHRRKQLLHKLRLMDFYMLQHSTWVHPFECEKQIGALVTHLHLEEYVSFVLVEKANFEDNCVKHFKQIGLLM